MKKPKKIQYALNFYLVGLRILAGHASRAAVAAASGLSEPTCWRIESAGGPEVSPDSLAAYAAAVGVDPDDLAALRSGDKVVAARVIRRMPSGRVRTDPGEI